MDKINITVMFEIPGKMGATGLANLDNAYTEGVEPTAMRVSSGDAMCGYGGFIIRVPIVGPASRVILSNSGTEMRHTSFLCMAMRPADTEAQDSGIRKKIELCPL